jgi:endonuclease/exonuclease/phosphatase (EEP) superfamily protein YafD
MRLYEEESLLRIGEAVLWFLAVMSLLAHVELGPNYVLELISHFQIQYVLIGLFAAVYYFVSKRFWGMSAALLLLVSALIHVTPYLGLLQKADALVVEKQTFRLITANVLRSNTNYTALHKALRTFKPDCALLQEIDQNWVRSLTDLQSHFPYLYFYPRKDDGYGLALVCRTEPSSYFLGFLRADLSPVALAEFRLGKETFRLVGVHTHNPLFPSNWRLQREEFREIARYVKSSNVPILLAGDLNATNWSPVFQKFLRQSGLSDPRHQRGFFLSWRGWLPFDVIPIDHVLPDKKMSVNKVEAFDISGSDHRGMVVDISLEKKVE